MHDVRRVQDLCATGHHVTTGEDVTLRQDRVAIHRHYFWDKGQVQAAEQVKTRKVRKVSHRTGGLGRGRADKGRWRGSIARVYAEHCARSHEHTHQPGTAAASP